MTGVLLIPMTNEILSAQTLLLNTGISILDCARIIRNILDSAPTKSTLTKLQFCNKVIETGLRQVNLIDVAFSTAFECYLKTKKHLRKDSFSDIKYLGNKLIKNIPQLSERNVSEITRGDCEEWLQATFSTPSQFNKARSMLHTFFEFALRREWCEKNPIRLIEKKKVIEKEIQPLSLKDCNNLLRNAQKYSAPVGILVLAGIRPKEIHNLKWNDIDLDENTITIRSQCSKTGGVRHVEICPKLKRILINAPKISNNICPPNWTRKWKCIRDNSGFKNCWVQDVLRHTYASFHTKYYKSLSRLQLNMGHRDQSLLRSRYVNMYGISHIDAKDFFTG